MNYQGIKKFITGSNQATFIGGRLCYHLNILNRITKALNLENYLLKQRVFLKKLISEPMSNGRLSNIDAAIIYHFARLCGIIINHTGKGTMHSYARSR